MIRHALMTCVVVAVLGIFATGCKSEVKASVNCKGQADGINCEVAETLGDSKVKVCWNIKANCKNGTVVTGAGCAEVSGGGKASELVPNNKLENDEKCDSAETMSVENLTITAS